MDFDINGGNGLPLSEAMEPEIHDLKILNNYCLRIPGKIRLGSKVHIGYYDQEHQVRIMEKTLFNELRCIPT